MNRRFLEKASPTRIYALFGLFPRALGDLLAAAAGPAKSAGSKTRRGWGPQTAAGPLSRSADDVDLPAA